MEKVINKQNYASNGFAVYKNFLNKENIKSLNDKISELEETLPISDTVFDEDGTGKIKQIQYLHKKDKIFEELLTKIIPIGIDLLGHEQFSVLNMQLFEKHPEISKPTRSHQDNAYFKVNPPTAITIWIALDDIDEENGCLYYAPMTHLTPTRKHQRYHKHTTFRTRSGVPGLSICLHEHPEEHDIPMIVSAGDVLAHHSNLIHRAGKNNSENRRRRAIGIVFIPDECKQDDLLTKYHNDRLREDIELQKIKDPKLYRELKAEYKDL
jgi:phytanoyl-CoA hydroxylase